MSTSRTNEDDGKMLLPSNTTRHLKAYDSGVVAAIAALPIVMVSARLLIEQPAVPAWACLSFEVIVVCIVAFVSSFIAYIQFSVPHISALDHDGIYIRGYLSVTYMIPWRTVTSVKRHAHGVVLFNGRKGLPVVWRYTCNRAGREDLLHFINASIASTQDSQFQ